MSEDCASHSFLQLCKQYICEQTRKYKNIHNMEANWNGSSAKARAPASDLAELQFQFDPKGRVSTVQ
eukprot:gene6394-biopygen2417